MFLFTTSPQGAGSPPSAARSAPAAGTPVTEAIRQGAEATGARFEYLLATARRESALDPGAKARTSSASGLFQFIDQTWLGTVKADGPRLGLAAQAQQITARADGTYTVEDPAARQAILDLRNDPKVASVMAGALTQRNRAQLSAETGREPSDADLYIAHFLGARGASALIRAAETQPARAAASDFPEAAAANRSIFYDRSGRARSAGEVYAVLGAAHAARPEPGAASPAAAPAQAAERPSFHGLFQTEGRRGPVSDAVARLWRGGEGGTRVAALGFFPRSDGTTSSPGTPPAATVDEAAPKLVDMPLPPRRPADLSAPPTSPSRRGAPAPRAPLDLSSFRAQTSS